MKVLPFFALGCFAIMLIAMPVLPAFAHGGHQPPAANFEGKKASVFLKLDPPVVKSSTEPVTITARFFDENTNENFKEVTYRIFFKKDGKEIPIETTGGQFGGQGFFYHPTGNLQIKVVPKNTEVAVAKGESEPQFGGTWNRGGPVVVEGPIFTEPGLYNLFVEIHTAGTTRTQVAPVLQYDVWVTPGREETIKVPNGSKTEQVMVRNYYGAIQDSGFDPATKTIKFSMPFDWKSNMVEKIGMLHTEVFIPKALSDFDRESLKGGVNGIETPVFVDNYGEKETVVHFTISQSHLLELRNQIKAGNVSPSKAMFTLSPPESEAKVVQVTKESKSYSVVISHPERLVAGSPAPFGVRISKAGEPVGAATYEMAILDKDGKEAYRSGGVTTPEGISSQDVTLKAAGAYTVRIDKINASSESVQSDLQLEPGKAKPGAATKVTAKATSKGTSIKIKNAAGGVAVNKVTFEVDSDVTGKVRVPSGWKAQVDGKTVTVTAASKVIKAAKSATFVIPVKAKNVKWATFNGASQLDSGSVAIK
jgi:hypothetical protein